MGPQKVGHDWETELNFSYCRQQQQKNISRSDCDLWRKVDFIQQPLMTSSVARLSRSSKALSKVKLASKKVMVTVWWSDPLLLSERWGNHYIWEICSANWWNAFKITTATARHWLTERAQFSPWQCPTTCHTTNASKVEWSFASSAIFTWHLTNWLPLPSGILTTFCWENASITSMMQKMLSKEFTEFQSMDFLYYRNKQTYFSLAKTCWL